MSVFVIMASYLGQYHSCSQNRESKFIRAVDSFLNNNYDDKTLIIVSDGCEKTLELYNDNYSKYPNIRCLLIEKQILFSGKVRDTGLKLAKDIGNPEDIVCYLDTDDRFGENHLSHIAKHFGDNDFVIYDTHRYSTTGWYISKVAMQFAHIGTSSFAHKLKLEMSWPDGYGHDWGVIESISKRYKYSEIPLAEYYIHHVPNADC